MGENLSGRSRSHGVWMHADRRLRPKAFGEPGDRGIGGSFFLRLSDALRRAPDVRAVQEVATRLLLERLGASRIQYVEIDGDAGARDPGVVIRSSCGSDRPPMTGRYLMSDLGLERARLSSGEPTVVSDADADDSVSPGELDACRALGVAAWLSVPLVRDGHFVAALVVHQSRPRVWTKDEVLLVQETAERTWGAIERARAEAVTRESLQRLEILSEANALLLSCAEPEAVIQEIAEKVMAHLGCALFFNYILDEERAKLHLNAHAGVSGAAAAELEWLEPGRGICGRVLREGGAIVSEDVQRNGDESVALVRTLGLTAYACQPLRVGGRAIGTLSFGTRRKTSFSDGETALMHTVADQLSVALQRRRDEEERARLLAVEHERRTRVEALHGVMEVAVSSLDTREAAARMLAYLGERHGFEHSSVWLVRGDELELMACRGCPPRYAERTSPMPLSSPDDAARVFLSGTPVTVPDMAEADPATRDRYRGLGVDVGAYAIVPLRARGRTVGTLHFGWRRPRRISAEDVQFFASLGHELGVVLENARLYESERDIANRLQEALLSLPAGVPGVEFAHAYHSATEAARVGGDFYDIFELHHGLVGIVIGDVAGKGLDAAVLTSMTKNTIRAHASERGKTPARVLGLTNDVVYTSTPTEAFVTVFFGILDCRDGRLVYANAGHTTSAVVSGDGDVGRLAVTGPLLGAFPDAEFGQAETMLDVDQLLFLYTDGVTDARRDGRMYGEDALFRCLASTGGLPARDAVMAVIEDAVGFSESRLRDDLAILAVRRTEPEAETPHQQKLRL